MSGRLDRWLTRHRREWEDAEFANEVKAAEVQGTPPLATLLLATIAAFVLAAVGWASVAMLDEVTHARGRIIPSSEVQVVQHLEGGILKAMEVSEGQVVEQGQRLLQVDNTASKSRFGELKSNYYALLGQVARLSAEAEDHPLEFPPELLSEAHEVALHERQLFDARHAELQSQLKILQQQREQRGHELEELQGKLERGGDRLRLVAEELKMIEPLARQKIVPRVNLLKLKREESEVRGEIDATRSAIAKTRSAIEEARNREEERTLTFLTGALDELNARQAELAAAKETLAAQRDRVARTDIRSPVRGVVKSLKIRTLGGVIQPGADLVEIVPLEDTLLVEALVPPADIAFIRPGQRAMVKLSAYDFTIYGGLRGKVERISADTLVDERGEAHYKLIVRTEDNALTVGERRLPIMPGMVATVDVITGRKSVLSYLLKPILRARATALRER
ncbi:HlyD family type I secretion periplasmic adaptor subunit [Endothiovibrio diazotrophicus]